MSSHASGLGILLGGLGDGLKALPGRLLRKVGLGLRTQFVIGGRSVTLPNNVGLTARQAFHEVGTALESGLPPQRFADVNRRGGRSKESPIPEEVWHSVLDLFVDAGILELYYEVIMPVHNSTTWMSAFWSSEGVMFDGSHDRLLSENEMHEFRGIEYATYLKDHPVGAPLEKVALTDEHFGRTYRLTSASV